MGQKTDTLERDRTDTGSKSYGSSSTPPSWSEISEKADTKQGTQNTLALSGVALVFGSLLPIGVIPAVFLTTLIGSVLGFGGIKSGAIAGGVVGGLSAFLGSIIVSILTLGLATVPTILAGVIIGGLGGYIGSKLRK